MGEERGPGGSAGAKEFTVQPSEPDEPGEPEIPPTPSPGWSAGKMLLVSVGAIVGLFVLLIIGVAINCELDPASCETETPAAASDAAGGGEEGLETTAANPDNADGGPPAAEDAGDGSGPGATTADQDSSGTSGEPTTTASDDPSTSAPPTAEAVSPTSLSLTVGINESTWFEGRCLNPDGALSYATWTLRRPGATVFEELANDTVDQQADPWGPRAWQLSFEEPGSFEVRWTCVNEDGVADALAWHVTVPEPTESQFFADEPFPTIAPDGELRIEFVDVGQGEGIVLHFPDSTVVVDTGRWDGPGETAVRDHLVAEGITDLRAMVFSHADADHTGGCDEVLESLTVPWVLHPGAASTTETWGACSQAITDEGATLHTDGQLDPGTYLNWSAHATVRVLHLDALTTDRNEGSLVLHVTYGTFDLLLTGDIGCQTEDALLTGGLVQDVELLKVAHHGSASATCTPWLDTTKPELGVISVGATNNYGHPTQEVLDRLASHNVDVYRTDQHGGVTVTTDGTSWQVDTEKTPAPPEEEDPPEEDPPPPDPPEPGGVTITEIQYDPSGPDQGDNLVNEWVEITNNGDQAVDMGGWLLEDEKDHEYTFPSGFTLEPGASVKVRTGHGTDTATDLYWNRGSAVWNNSGGDTAFLYDGTGTLVDERGY